MPDAGGKRGLLAEIARQADDADVAAFGGHPAEQREGVVARSVIHEDEFRPGVAACGLEGPRDGRPCDREEPADAVLLVENRDDDGKAWSRPFGHRGVHARDCLHLGNLSNGWPDRTRSNRPAECIGSLIPRPGTVKILIIAGLDGLCRRACPIRSRPVSAIRDRCIQR